MKPTTNIDAIANDKRRLARSRRCQAQRGGASAALFQMRAQRIDRGELHRACGNWLRSSRRHRACRACRRSRRTSGSPGVRSAAAWRRLRRGAPRGRLVARRGAAPAVGIGSRWPRLALGASAGARPAARRRPDRDPATPGRTVLAPSAARAAAWRAASARRAARRVGFGRRVRGSATRPSARARARRAGGIGGRCGGRGDSGASSGTSTIGGSAAGGAHRTRRAGSVWRAASRAGRAARSRRAGKRGSADAAARAGAAASAASAAARQVRGLGGAAIGVGTGDGGRRRRDPGGRRHQRSTDSARPRAPRRAVRAPRRSAATGRARRRAPIRMRPAATATVPDDDQRVAEAERIDRNAKSDRQKPAAVTSRPTPTERDSSAFRPLPLRGRRPQSLTELWRPSGSSARTGPL